MTAIDACAPDHRAAGTYAPDCLIHASWRCVTSGCVYPAVDAHLCVGCGRRAGVR